MAAGDASLAYDEIPYPSAPYPYSHCDHLAIVARLFGIPAADVRQCRVLEVGCADGANLIPMALTLPQSRFVGIDVSARQVSAGNALVEKLGLTNIELRRQDLAEFAPAEGSFDYLIAHGVYSWTPPEVQTRLLDLCRSCLAENGVAFVSYNVYPGWQQRMTIRQWLLRATKDSAGTALRLQQVRRLIAGLRQTLSAGGQQRALVEELARLEAWNDGYLRHDLLEEHNEPLLFTEFVDRIEAHGLRFFAEADVASMAGAGLPPGVWSGLQRLGGSLIGREQLLDLVANRAFRQSLLCRAECQPRAQLDASAVESAYVASSLRRKAAAGAAGGEVRFESPNGFALEVTGPAVAEVLDRLQAAWPGGAWFAELIARGGERETLASVLLAGFVERAVTLHTVASAAATTISEHPVASPLARLQAAAGPWVTNLRHDVVELDTWSRQFLCQLDGTHDRRSLVHFSAALSQAGQNNPEVDTTLRRFLKAGLLIS